MHTASFNGCLYQGWGCVCLCVRGGSASRSGEVSASGSEGGGCLPHTPLQHTPFSTPLSPHPPFTTLRFTTPPPSFTTPRVDKKTSVKILPCPKLRLRAGTMGNSTINVQKDLLKRKTGGKIDCVQPAVTSFCCNIYITEIHIDNLNNLYTWVSTDFYLIL